MLYSIFVIHMKYEEVQAELHKLATQQCVCNKTNFKWFKDRAHEAVNDALRAIVEDSEIWYISTPYWHQFDSCIKNVESDKFPEATKEQKVAVLEVLYKWKENARQLKEVEPLIISGRKPGVRKTPARALENTGTCAICGKNCKLDGGKRVVSHGFTVEYHQQNGSCFGVGYKPWELSPEGAIGLIEKCLIPEKTQLEQSSRILVWSPKTQDITASAQRAVNREISCFERRIAEWTETELPK